MKHVNFYKVVLLLLSAMLLDVTVASAQNLNVNIGDDGKKENKDEKKEEAKKNEPSHDSSEKKAPSLEYELKRIFGAKSETSLEGPRVENLGKYFLDKYTGQVTLITFHRGDPIRWNILRDYVPDDYVYDKDSVNYQLIRFGDHSDNLILLNLNSGVMWAIDTKGFTYKNTRLVYIPVTNTEW